MRKALRALGWIATVVLVVVLGALVYLALAYPKADDPPAVEIEPAPALLARGEYLFENVAGCVICHSPHEPTVAGGRVIRGSEGAGGPEFPIGSAGTLYAKNITPAALGEWTDGEIVRALRDGVSRDGSALFPLMPYFSFRRLSEFDLSAIVAYTRTLAPRESEVPERELSFPMNLIVRMMPGPAGPYPAAPDPSDAVAYGEYMVTAASCGDCHSPMDDRGTPLPGQGLSGGNPFPTGDGWVAHTANITPDSATGIGLWTRERFVSNFRERAAAAGSPLSENVRLTPMPWIAYARMTDEDLGAVYDYLRTVPPVRNEVVKFTREEAGSRE